MNLASQKGDPAFASMTLDILGNILSRAEDPRDLGVYLTEEIRELTGARCILLLQCQGGGLKAKPRVMGITPHRRKAWAESPDAAEFFETLKTQPEIRLWRGSETSETADYLRRHGFELSLAIPFNVGATCVGALLVLGLPDELHLASLVDLLSALSTTLALVLRNAFLFEKQEQIIQERTAVLQETNEKLRIELIERKTAEARVTRLTQLYAALSQCNQAIVHSSSMEELFPQICRDVVKFGGMKLAWIGMLDETTGRVHPVASFGSGADYLEGIEISVDAGKPSGRGPMGTAIRENQPICFQDFQNDPRSAHWHERAAQYGWAAVAALPLCLRGKPIASLSIYSDVAGVFDEEVRKLLVEMAEDIGFALDSFAHEAERKQAEMALKASEARFKSMFDEAPLGIALVDSLTARFYSVNPMFAKIAGRPAEELEQIDWKTITHPDDIQADVENMAAMNAGKIPGFQMPKRYLRPDGTYVWINITVAPMYVEDKAHPRHLLMIEEISERKRMEDELRASEARFRALYEKAPLGISRIDSLTGRFLQVNAKSCEIHGRPCREMLEMDFPSITHPEDLEQDLENMKQLREGKIRHFEMDKRLVRPDGSIVWVNLTVVPEWAEGEPPTCHIAMVADITERKQAEEALFQAKEAAEAANQAKDQFIAVLSHELRTPLTPVLATVTALNAENNLPPEVHANLEMIRQNVELEARLIDDLLDVTRIAKGKMVLVQELMDAHACLLTAVEICQSEIAEKRLDFSLDLQAARHHVHGDATRLRQVFWNLLKNALKFTAPGGSIRIRSANVNERLVIECTDTGIGIEPELLPQIFDQFQQGELTKIRRFGGLGLGLSIAKTVVEMHHGLLTASSEGQGRGATFSVTLDTIPAPSLSPSVVETAPPVGGKVQGQRILLVEDHPDTLRILAKLLQKWGYSVTTAPSVRDALEAAQAQAFDLMVSDLGLPDGSGLELMRRLNEHGRLRGIAVSGFGTEEDIRQSRAAGFQEHLIKPVDAETLRDAVQRAVTKVGK